MYETLRAVLAEALAAAEDGDTGSVIERIETALAMVP
jgi:hypothetical protein